MRILRISAVMLAFALACPALSIQPSSAKSVSLCLGHIATIVGSEGPDRIKGTDGADVIVGLAGNDVILAKDGADVVCGRGGQDRIRGEDGRDLLSGGGNNDRLNGGLASDHLDGDAGSDTLRSPGGRDTMVGGSGTDNLFHGSHLFGGPANDYLNGRDGETDVLLGGEGDDQLNGGLGEGDIAVHIFSPGSVQANLETVNGEGMDSLEDVEGLTGSMFDDVLTGDDGINTIRGMDGADHLDGAGGADFLDGGSGDDSVDGSSGMDWATFLSSPVGVEVSIQTGKATGNGSDDLAGIENLYGSYYDDVLWGNEDPNWLGGASGNNEIVALGGDDTVEFAKSGDAGAGNDLCTDAFIENCEHAFHTDPLSHAIVETPGQASIIPKGDFETARGSIGFGIDGENSKKVYVAIRLLTTGGCKWWEEGEGLTVRACATPLWNKAEVEQDAARGTTTWSLPVGGALPVGIYELRASVGPDRGCPNWFGPSCVDFRLD